MEKGNINQGRNSVNDKIKIITADNKQELVTKFHSINREETEEAEV